MEQWQEVDVMKKHSSDRPKYKRGNVADIALASVPNTSEEKLVQGAMPTAASYACRAFYLTVW
ncbi:hypothetical protein [Nostoc sp. DedQUE08]|uniref:hypothetical protein n=1 Tax=Nostoc sp. DedQUE08 TaxID=3075393 RepID=UPI002AD2C00F|nr:hypothetical protein [Nostoc sp. DedQUE08]